MAQHSGALGLRPGEWVAVRSKEEILATLAPDATLDGLPFMPEMLRFCGLRFQIHKRADKTCDTVDKTGGRRLHNTVHIQGLRCDGSAHGGCEAGCLMFWREAWLKRVDDTQAASSPAALTHGSGCCTEADVERAAAVDASHQIFRCQITQLKTFTEPLRWWDIRQYVRDVMTNAVPLGKVARAFLFAAFRNLIALGIGYRVLVGLYEWVQTHRRGVPFPLRSGTCHVTPTAVLGLQPGELVRVKSYPQILATLDRTNKNRGLWFDPELVKYCGGTYRALKRVRRILDEKTGKMLEFSNPCIVLQGVFCTAETTQYRLFCPRNIWIYWREIWLERVSNQEAPVDATSLGPGRTPPPAPACTTTAVDAMGSATHRRF
jgi:hypothetical protein